MSSRGQELAPRLHRAWHAFLAEETVRRRRLRRLRQQELDAERLLEHRELQLIRAEATGDGRYIVRRQHKLGRSREQLRRVRSQIQELER